MGSAPLLAWHDVGFFHATWKVQCQMALMKDSLWNIVTGAEVAPPVEERDKHARYLAKRDMALAVIVLSVEPSLLYLLGEPVNPQTVWEKLRNQFQKKTWANKLSLRRRLYSLRLKDGDSVQDHIKALTEIFNELSIVDDPVTEEDRVVHLLASLPDSFGMLVTALESSAEVPEMEVVTERLLHAERKMSERDGDRDDRALFSKRGKGPQCYYCGKFGHIRKNCLKLQKRSENPKVKKNVKYMANKTEARPRKRSSSSSSESVGLITAHAMSTGRPTADTADYWIVDSGATCHMSNKRVIYADFQNFQKPRSVTLGDGHSLEATWQGTVRLEVKLPSGKSKSCKLRDVFYVPKLSYNLLSVSKAAEAGKMTVFTETKAEILDSKGKLVAAATRKRGCIDRKLMQWKVPMNQRKLYGTSDMDI